MEYSEKTAWLSIVVNLLLVAIKTAVALISGSLAVTADAVHSLSDVISSAIILIGIKISERHAPGFPYGLYKVENLVALGTSFLIFFAGFEIIKTVLSGSSNPFPSHIPLAVGGISITILITWLFSRYELQVGTATGSPSLIADARHVRVDMLSSMLILMALVGSGVGLAIDKYAAVIVVVFIARSAFTILVDSIRVLLDASLDYKSMDRIREIVLADPRVAEIKDIWARNAGRYKFIELDLVLRVRELEKGHRLSEEIENRVKMEISQVDRVLIHFQARELGVNTIGIPLTEDRLTISEHFGEAPFFRLLKLQRAGGDVIEEQIFDNPFLDEKKAKGIKVAQWLLEKGIDVLISTHDQSGKGPGFVLGNGGAEILVTKETSADKAVAMMQNSQGEKL